MPKVKVYVSAECRLLHSWARLCIDDFFECNFSQESFETVHFKDLFSHIERTVG